MIGRFETTISRTHLRPIFLLFGAMVVLCLYASFFSRAEGQDAGKMRPALPNSKPTSIPTPAPRATLPRNASLPQASQESPYFRIGFLRPEQESTLGRDWYESIRKALLEDNDFASAMPAAGLSDVRLRPCDGPEDMLQRMGQAEFDLLYCPAMVYVQNRISNPDQYLVTFQTRRRNVDQGDAQGLLVRRYGVLFSRSGAGLGGSDEYVRTGEVKELLSRPDQVLAVSGAYDAAGYFYVRKMLWDEYEKCSPRLLFCGSPQNVVKAVSSGLCDMGACEENALIEVFNTIPKSADLNIKLSSVKPLNDLVRIINKTKGVPTDPIVMRAPYDPTLNMSPRGLAGAAVAKALIRLHISDDNAPVLEKGVDEVYDGLQADYEATREYKW